MMPEPLFEYSIMDGIHCLSLLKATGEGLKAMLDEVEARVVEKPINGKNLVLLDFRPAGPPHMASSLPHIIGFFARQARRTPQPVRVAYVYTYGSHGRILNAFLTVQRFMPQGMAAKFFPDAEYTQAIAWLHAG